MNIIRNNEHQIENWNINSVPVTLLHKFAKDSKSQISSKQLFFVNDQAGLAVFENTPDGKNSIYYFNFTSKSSIIFQHMLTMSSLQAELIIEPINRQWCIIDNKYKRVNLGKLTKDGKIEDGSPISVFD